MRISDWSSDVCSSDLRHRRGADDGRGGRHSRLHRGLPGAAAPARRSCLGGRAGTGRDAKRMSPMTDASGRRDGIRAAVLSVLILTLLLPPAAEPAEARSVEHTSELPSLMRISSAAFCLKKKKQPPTISLAHRLTRTPPKP